MKKFSAERFAAAQKKTEHLLSGMKECRVHYCKLSDEEHESIYDRQKLWIALNASGRQELPPPKQFRPPEHPFSRKRKTNPNNATTAKKSKNSEQRNDYIAVFGNSKYITMRQLFEINQRFSQNKGSPCLKGKIYAVLHEGEEKIFKNDDEESRIPKKNFLEWATDYRDDWVRLDQLRRRAVTQGFRVCGQILDIMFMMSQNNYNEMGAKFQVFEEALRWVSKDEESVVICKVLDLIKAVDIQLKGKKTSQNSEDDDLNESFLDLFLLKFLSKIFRLEIFWVHRGLPRERRLLVDEVFASLEGEINRCELSIMEMDDDIEEAGEDGQFGVLVEDWKEGDDYVRMELKIEELWGELDD